MSIQAKNAKWAALLLIGWYALTAALTGCGSNPAARKVTPAQAEVKGFLPNTVTGMVTFTDAGQQGLHIRADLLGLLPNREYAIHIHETGDCSSPEATGPHFDPGHSNHHGAPGGAPDTHHAGDLPNLTTDAQGQGHLDYTTSTLGIGFSDFSVLGRSVVVHAEKDDYTSQPAGNSGEKIACGVIRSAG